MRKCGKKFTYRTLVPQWWDAILVVSVSKCVFVCSCRMSRVAPMWDLLKGGQLWVENVDVINAGCRLDFQFPPRTHLPLMRTNSQPLVERLAIQWNTSLALYHSLSYYTHNCIICHLFCLEALVWIISSFIYLVPGNYTLRATSSFEGTIVQNCTCLSESS
jgi:hypothetical protein